VAEDLVHDQRERGEGEEGGEQEERRDAEGHGKLNSLGLTFRRFINEHRTANLGP
jgi:hypothetical protein